MEWSKGAQEHMAHMLPNTGKVIKEACNNMDMHEATADDKMMAAKLDDEKTYNTVEEVNADAMKA
ncbi:hypothetical protein HY065_00685 [Candidatus Berkelbacteria bacterium]|nr:hypothetical protein [Candidatus Berkelbacteria bacterium]